MFVSRLLASLNIKSLLQIRLSLIRPGQRISGVLNSVYRVGLGGPDKRILAEAVVLALALSTLGISPLMAQATEFKLFDATLTSPNHLLKIADENLYRVKEKKKRKRSSHHTGLNDDLSYTN